MSPEDFGLRRTSRVINSSFDIFNSRAPAPPEASSSFLKAPAPERRPGLRYRCANCKAPGVEAGIIFHVKAGRFCGAFEWEPPDFEVGGIPFFVDPTVPRDELRLVGPGGEVLRRLVVAP